MTFEVLKFGGMRSCALEKVLLLVLIYVFGIGMATLADSQAPRNLRKLFRDSEFVSRKAEFETLPDSMFTIFRDLAKF